MNLFSSLFLKINKILKKPLLIKKLPKKYPEKNKNLKFSLIFNRKNVLKHFTLVNITKGIFTIIIFRILIHFEVGQSILNFINPNLSNNPTFYLGVNSFISLLLRLPFWGIIEKIVEFIFPVVYADSDESDSSKKDTSNNNNNKDYSNSQKKDIFNLKDSDRFYFLDRTKSKSRPELPRLITYISPISTSTDSLTNDLEKNKSNEEEVNKSLLKRNLEDAANCTFKQKNWDDATYRAYRLLKEKK